MHFLKNLNFITGTLYLWLEIAAWMVIQIIYKCHLQGVMGRAQNDVYMSLSLTKVWEGATCVKNVPGRDVFISVNDWIFSIPRFSNNLMVLGSLAITKSDKFSFWNILIIYNVYSSYCITHKAFFVMVSKHDNKKTFQCLGYHLKIHIKIHSKIKQTPGNACTQ